MALARGSAALPTRRLVLLHKICQALAPSPFPEGAVPSFLAPASLWAATSLKGSVPTELNWGGEGREGREGKGEDVDLFPCLQLLCPSRVKEGPLFVHPQGEGAFCDE